MSPTDHMPPLEIVAAGDRFLGDACLKPAPRKGTSGSAKMWPWVKTNGTILG